MSRIGVISAFNPYNYGMYSVDLAAHHFFGQLNQAFTPIVTQRRTRVGRLSFELVRDPAQLGAFDTLVYWGDFLNNPMWGAGDYGPREISRHRARDAAQAWADWLALYLQAKQRHPHLRVYALGGCFLGADDPSLAHARDALREFVVTAELVAPRDPRSFEFLRSLAPQGPLIQGMDNAWLLPFDPAPGPATPGHFVHFFGRTLRRAPKAFIDDISRTTGLRPVRVDWMNWRRPRFVAHWNFMRMHRAIASARFVVTDAYHLVINSLNRRVPVVCLYDAEQSASDGSCADAKKRILMEQLGLQAWLVDVQAGEPLDQRVLQSLQQLSDADAETAWEGIDQRRAAYRSVLSSALGSPLGSARQSGPDT